MGLPVLTWLVAPDPVITTRTVEQKDSGQPTTADKPPHKKHIHNNEPKRTGRKFAKSGQEDGYDLNHKTTCVALGEVHNPVNRLDSLN